MADATYTHLSMLLDRSGSMQSIKDATTAGFDEFMLEQRGVAGRCTVTLAQFDNEYEEVYTDRDIAAVPPLDLQPRGMTALLDSIARLVHSTSVRIAQLPEDQRPATVIVGIMTDGHENASKEYTHAAIKALVTERETLFGWTFLYMGANQDAIEVGESIGVARERSLTYEGVSAGAAYGAASASMSRLRQGVAAGAPPPQLATRSRGSRPRSGPGRRGASAGRGRAAARPVGPPAVPTAQLSERELLAWLTQWRDATSAASIGEIGSYGGRKLLEAKVAGTTCSSTPTRRATPSSSSRARGPRAAPVDGHHEPERGRQQDHVPARRRTHPGWYCYLTTAQAGRVGSELRVRRTAAEVGEHACLGGRAASWADRVSLARCRQGRVPRELAQALGVETRPAVHRAQPLGREVARAIARAQQRARDRRDRVSVASDPDRGLQREHDVRLVRGLAARRRGRAFGREVRSVVGHRGGLGLRDRVPRGLERRDRETVGAQVGAGALRLGVRDPRLPRGATVGRQQVEARADVQAPERDRDPDRLRPQDARLARERVGVRELGDRAGGTGRLGTVVQSHDPDDPRPHERPLPAVLPVAACRASLAARSRPRAAREMGRVAQHGGGLRPDVGRAPVSQSSKADATSSSRSSAVRPRPRAATRATHTDIWVSSLHSPGSYGPSPPPRNTATSSALGGIANSYGTPRASPHACATRTPAARSRRTGSGARCEVTGRA
ncbi:hypothetical protein NKG05_11165 [Oerskovia sp. M15]